MEFNSCFRKIRNSLSVFGILFLFEVPVVPAENLASADTFEILVSRDLVDLTKAKPPAFGQLTMDSVPLLEFRDISFLRFDPVRQVEYAVEFMPDVYERLRPRLPKLYMRSFIIFLGHEPVYSGIIVPDDFSKDYLKKAHYSGPVIKLPPRNVDLEKSKGLKIGFFSENGIYSRSDDPRGNKAMIDLFRKSGKILF
jgi:hypothetical protein